MGCLIAFIAQLEPLSIAMNIRMTKSSVIGLNTNSTTAAGLMSPITTFVAHRVAKRSSRLARVCARTSKSLSEGVSESRYQPVESLETRRRWRGRMRGEDEGELVGVVDADGIDLAAGETMAKEAAGRPVRTSEVVFILESCRRLDKCNGSNPERVSTERMPKETAMSKSNGSLRSSLLVPREWKPNCRNEETHPRQPTYYVSSILIPTLETVSPHPLSR